MYARRTTAEVRQYEMFAGMDLRRFASVRNILWVSEMFR